ncbi:MAG: hypothetical protein JXJ04_06360 [Spirochaetales bacterium]|nr:hypothetical protein [Spirochaetales bacterium]
MLMLQKTGTVLFLLVLLTFFTFIMVRNAWMSDDAFITFRTVDNFINGYGLTWNTDERVQAYTHPLWMFFVSLFYYFTHEIYFTVIILSLIVSLLAVAFYTCGIAGEWHKALIGISILCFSKAFIDYTTSGLENPLTFLLCAVFFVIYYRFRMQLLSLFFLSLIAAFCTVNRLDTILFFLPVLVYGYVSTRRWVRGAAVIFLGFLPLLCWMGFSLFYYGFPFPNTFYAKVNTGIDQIALINQGLAYILDTIHNDPITILIIIIGIVSYFFTKDKRTIPASLGILLYCAYIVKIGGGFMSSRFFAAPLFCAVLILSFAPIKSFKIIWAPAFCSILFAGLFAPFSPVGSDETFINETIQENGIADERGFYYQRTGLIPVLKRKNWVPDHFWVTDAYELKEKGTAVAVRGYVGMMGFLAGPKVHFIDFHALTDPLLSRIFIEDVTTWRIGHFKRKIPAGYVQTIGSGENRFRDPHIAQFYDKLTYAIKDDLMRPGRFKEICNLNTGKYDHLLSEYKNEEIRVTLAMLKEPKEKGSSWDADGTYLFPEKGIRINLGRKYNAQQLEMSLAYNSEYKMSYYKAWFFLKEQTVYLPPGLPGKLALVTIKVPPEITKRGFTRIRIVPVNGNGNYSIGHLLLKENP